MPTFMQVVERLRERNLAPASGPVYVRDLAQKLGLPSACVRPLLLKGLEGVAQKRPWAVILCRYKGQQADPAVDQPIEDFYRRAFTPGSGGIVEYWRDASLGCIDISGSNVFGWVELEIPLDKAGIGTAQNPGPKRGDTVNYAINAAKKANLDPVTGFFNQIAIVTRNWSDPTLEGLYPTWSPGDPLASKYQYWIDGSEDGGSGKITLTPPHKPDTLASGNVLAHEMGHTLGMQHDVGSDLASNYADPCCIMSQQNSFTPPGWAAPFGPAVCLPHLVLQNWMFKRRLFTADSSWITSPQGIVLPLAPVTDPGAQANLGLKLHYKQNSDEWDYFVEYVKPVFWNQGLFSATNNQIPQSTAYVFVRRTANISDVGGVTAIFLNLIAVPLAPNVTQSIVEVAGNVLFEIQWLGTTDRILKVTVKKAPLTKIRRFAPRTG